VSDEEKKGGEYEKPESHDAGGEDLEEVSGGAGDSVCTAGDSVSGAAKLTGTYTCSTGWSAYAHCVTGPTPNE